MVYRTAPFPMTMNDPYFQFQGHARNGTGYRHSFNEILIETCTRPIQQNDLE